LPAVVKLPRPVTVLGRRCGVCLRLIARGIAT